MSRGPSASTSITTSHGDPGPHFFFALPWILLVTSPVSVAASPDNGLAHHCDAQLDASVDHPFGYRIRGDRCEGIYVRNVASATLRVVSLTERFEDYDLQSSKQLLVEWTTSGDSPVRLRAQGLRRRLYYRMDTVRSPQSRSFDWSLDVLSALKLPRSQLGVIGWTKSDQFDRDIYLPLRVSQSEHARKSPTYELSVLPGRELTEVFVSLAPVDDNGGVESFLKQGEPLGYGYYPAERAILISIPHPEAPGLYYVEIGASLRNGGATAIDFLLYHPPM